MWISSRRLSTRIGGLLVSVALLVAAAPAFAAVCPVQNGDGSIQCAGSNVFCGGTCVASDPVCSAPRTQINCGSCGCDCPSGQAYCGTFNTCVVPIACSGGQTYDACANGGAGGCVGNAYVVLNPSSAQSGNVNVGGTLTTGNDITATGNLRSSNDVYLASGKALRVDGTGTTSLNIGNWGGGATGLNVNVGSSTLATQLKVDGQATSLNMSRTTNSYLNRFIFSTGGVNDWQVGQLFVAKSFVIKNITSPPDVGTTSIYIDASDNIGIGNIQNPSSTLDMYGALTMRYSGVPAASPAAQGRIYFDTGVNKFKVSENGGAYSNLMGVSASGTPAAGQAAFWSSAGAVGGDNAFFWDNTTKRLGIGVAPSQALDVAGTVKTAGLQLTTGAGAGKVLQSDASGNATWTTPVTAPVSSVAGSGAGISVSPTTGAVVVSNTGVTSLVAGTGIGISGSTGAVTVTNSGVTGSGTANYVPRFITATTLGNTNITNDGSNTTIGSGTSATGGNAAAIGWDAVAGYGGSYAIGLRARTNWYYSVAIGQDAIGGGGSGAGHAFGIGAAAVAPFATAVGNYVNASGAYSTAIGMYANATGTGSIALGHGYGTTLVNSTDYSLGVGFNVSTPTFFVGPGTGAGTYGKVGIGDSTPTALLTVGNGDKLQIDGNGIITCIQGACPANGAIRMTPNLHLNSPAGNAVIANWDNGYTGGLQFRVGNGAGADVFDVLGNGKVGIGTTTPASKLDIVGGDINIDGGQTIYSRGRMHIDGEENLYLLNQGGVIVSKSWGGNGNLTVEGTSSVNGGAMNWYTGLASYGDYYGTYSSNSYGSYAVGGYYGYGMNAVGSTMGGRFYDSDNFTYAYLGYGGYSFYSGSGSMYNAGSISTSNDVSASTMYTSNWFRSTGASGWYNETYGGGMWMNDSTWVETYNGKRLWASGDMVAAQGSANYQPYIGDDGWGSDVQVGSLNAGISSLAAYNWGGNFRMNMYAAGFYTSSSRRWKKDIRTIDSALDMVMKLRGVYFKWKDGSPGATPDTKGDQVGLIAEEVGEVLPQIVKFDPDGSGAATDVSYERVGPVLIEAIKEQQTIIEKLQTRIDSLETRLDTVEARSN